MSTSDDMLRECDTLGTLVDEPLLLVAEITLSMDEGGSFLHQLKLENRGLRA